MLGHIYYAIGLFVTFAILSIILRFKKISQIRDWYGKFEKVTGKKPDKKEFRNKDELLLFESTNAFLIFECFWLIGGLLTNSWYIFITILLLQLIQTLILKPFKFSLFFKFFSFTFFLTKFFVYLYLVINHFHLHQDTYIFIKNFFR